MNTFLIYDIEYKICIIGVIVPFDAENMVAIRILASLQNKGAPLQNVVILSQIDLSKKHGSLHSNAQGHLKLYSSIAFYFLTYNHSITYLYV